MSTEFQPRPANEQFTITYELIIDVFGYLPGSGGTVLLERIAEDLDEPVEKILAVLDDLSQDKMLRYTHDNETVTIVSKREGLGKEHLALELSPRE